VSWRLFSTDSTDTGFNVYRDGTLLNSSPLTSATSYTDSSGSASATYTVRPVVSGVVGTAFSAGTTWSSIYKTIAIQQPTGGTTPDSVAYTYEANDGTVADLDGDGQYEIILKWNPTNSQDNSASGYTGNTIIDAYKLDGTRLWRIDLGKNIRSGAHYTSMVAYDLDGDGKAELMLKTADGTVDGAGTVIGDSSADYRNSYGYILSGPEYLTVFNGLTGAAMATTNYLPARGTVSTWGDSYGNRVDRFLAGVAYLDGKRPSAVFSRGYYTRAVIVSWDWRDGQLTQRWTYDSGTTKATTNAYGQGAHHFQVGDVNGDGKDDIVYGAATINSDGTLLYNTTLGHGDMLTLTPMRPDLSGQQVFMVHEESTNYGNYAMEMHDAATGTILWGYSDGTGADVGRGLCMDIDSAYAGLECWGSIGGLFAADGTQITSTNPAHYNFGIWWDGDLLRESLDGTVIDKWVPATSTNLRLLTLYNYGSTSSNNSTKKNPVISADILGDWREEVVLRSSDNTQLVIFSSTTATSYRMPTLMHDPQYRTQVAGQNMGYNLSPNTSFYLGYGMTLPVSWPAIYLAP
jgi:rhamnogalacturonan endolyase